MCYDFFGRKVSIEYFFILVFKPNHLHRLLYFLDNDKSSTERPSKIEPAVINILNRKTI